MNNNNMTIQITKKKHVTELLTSNDIYKYVKYGITWNILIHETHAKNELKLTETIITALCQP